MRTMKILEYFKNLIYLQLILGFIFSCTEYPDEFELGEEFIESKTNVTLIDTFSVEFATTRIDTIESNGSGTLIIGKYSDDIVGKIESSSYFQLGVPGTNYMEDDEIFDSLSLVLTYNSYSFGDTLQPSSFSVYRLNENIDYSYDNIIISSETFDYDPAPIGQLRYLPRPNGETDSIVVRLSDQLGLELYYLLQEDSETIESDDNFVNYFNGLVIIPDDPDNNAIISFSNDVRLMLYTHIDDITTEEYYYQFDIYEDTKLFNHYEYDFSSTNLSPLASTDAELTSDQLNGLAFIQGAVGLIAKVTFPSLNEILLFDRGTIMEAELSIAPLIHSFEDFSLPSELYIYQSSNINSILDYSDYLVYSTLVEDDLYDEENYYTFDLTDYLNSEISDNYIEDNSLIITLPLGTLSTKFSRLIIDAESKNTNLKIYYLSY